MKNYCPKGRCPKKYTFGYTLVVLTPLRSASDRLGFLTALTVMLTAAPSMAAENKITDLDITKDNNQLELKLSATNQADASFYTLRNNNTIEANILNTSLDLPEGHSFKQDKPMAGVKALEINQIDGKNTQILISTEANTPVESLFKQEGDDLILTLNRVTKADTLKQEIKEFGQKTVTNLKQTYKSALGQSKDKDNEKGTVPSIPNKGDAGSDILIPNPDVEIKDNRVNNIKEKVFTAQDSETELNDSTAPATLPRAAAPPVGDMAVSNINTMPDMVDLGSSALVSNLVLRDAPVREVLSMLAKTANLSLVYAGGDKAGDQASQGNGAEETGPTISLDLDNQPVQEVFNSVLLISGLNANRRGNIIYVGEKLPAQARNLISRTLRLNQVTSSDAAAFLASLGAEARIYVGQSDKFTVDKVDVSGVSTNINTSAATKPTVEALKVEPDPNAKGASVLEGLSISVDNRLNSITLVGEPGIVERATAYITQMDARRRQVSVNVKVIDVNLNNTDAANSSFSFGVNDSFFSQDKGSASLRFGNTPPINSTDLNVRNSLSGFSQNSVLPDKFLALLDSKITSGNAKILTDPTLIAQEGEIAVVKLTQEVIKSIKTSIDGQSGTRTVTPEIGEAGLKLPINIERIDDNGFVTLRVDPQVSAIGDSQRFDSGNGATNTINLLQTRELSSGLIRIRDGQTLILSGIIQDSEKTTVSKVPILGDIPLLGALFRSSNKNNTRAEVIVLLTPEIVEEDAGLASNFKPSKESREILEKQGVRMLDK